VPIFDPANIANIPAQLRESPTWVLWQYQQRGESRAKVPIRPLPSGGFANVNAHEPSSWVSFHEAAEIAGRHPDELGIGIVLVEGSGFEGLDFDDCIGEAGELHGEVAELINIAGSYAEVSPSGRGIRLLGYGQPLGSSDRKVSKTRSGIGIERYTGRRFLTITGNGAAMPLADMTALREILDASIFARKPPAPRQSNSAGDAGFDTAVCMHCLELLSPARCDDYYGWLKTGTALAELGDEHADAFIQWSSTSPSFDAEECRRKWDSLSRQATGDTGKAVGWMLAMAAEDSGIDRGRILADVAAKLGRDRSDRKLLQFAPRKGVVAQVANTDIDTLELPQPDGYRPFPIDSLPSPVREFVLEVSRALYCDTGSLATFVLVVLSAAVGTSRRVQIKRTWRPFPILWASVVAASGDLKSPPLELACEPMHARANKFRLEYEQSLEAYEEAKAEYEAARAAFKAGETTVRPTPPEEPAKPPKLLTNDCTVEALGAALADNPRGITLILDELAALLGGMDRYKRGSSDESFYLSAYDGRPHQIDRKGGDKPSIYVPRCAVPILGGIQPAKARELLDASRRSSGFVQRLLFCLPPRRAYRWTSDEPSGVTLHSYGALVSRLYRLEESDTGPEIIQPSPEALEAFVAWTGEHAKRSRGMSPDLAAAMSKLREIPARIGILLHECEIAAGRQEPGSPMAAGTMARAIDIAGWFRNEARRVYELLEADSMTAGDTILADACSAWILETLWEQGGPMSRRELAEALGSAASPASVVSALAQLLARGAVVRHEEGPSDSWEAVPDKPLPPATHAEFDAWAPPEAPQTEASDTDEGSLEI
jgi:hypothetical protein